MEHAQLAGDAPMEGDAGDLAELARLHDQVARLEHELARLRQEAGAPAAHTLAITDDDMRRAAALYAMGELTAEQAHDPTMSFAAALAALIAEAVDAAWDLAHLHTAEPAEGDPPLASAIRARAREGRRASGIASDSVRSRGL